LPAEIGLPFAHRAPFARRPRGTLGLTRPPFCPSGLPLPVVSRREAALFLYSSRKSSRKPFLPSQSPIVCAHVFAAKSGAGLGLSCDFAGARFGLPPLAGRPLRGSLLVVASLVVHDAGRQSLLPPDFLAVLDFEVEIERLKCPACDRSSTDTTSTWATAAGRKALPVEIQLESTRESDVPDSHDRTKRESHCLQQERQHGRVCRLYKRWE
jgi:hypothetical protein